MLKRNIYLTGKGVTVFNKEGKKIKHIDIKGGWTANVCFGGKDNDLLFITSSKSRISQMLLHHLMMSFFLIYEQNSWQKATVILLQ